MMNPVFSSTAAIPGFGNSGTYSTPGFLSNTPSIPMANFPATNPRASNFFTSGTPNAFNFTTPTPGTSYQTLPGNFTPSSITPNVTNADAGRVMNSATPFPLSTPSFPSNLSSINTISTNTHPLVILEMLSLAYDTTRPDHCLFSHVFWNVSGDASNRVPVTVFGFDALRERSESQSHRQLVLKDKATELIEKLDASLPILTQSDLRLNSIKKRLFYTQLILLRLFKQLEIIRKYSTPVKDWERGLFHQLESLYNTCTSLNDTFAACTTLKNCKNNQFYDDSSRHLMNSNGNFIIAKKNKKNSGNLLECFQVLETIQAALDVIVKGINNLHTKSSALMLKF